MLAEDLKEEDFKDRKEYLVHLAVLFIRSHTGFMGIDDSIFLDEVECDGYALANDLCYEFDLYELGD